MSALSEVDTAFEGRTLAELVRIEPILIACHLFKGLGDSGDEKRARICACLRSALEIGDLCNNAFTVWAILVNSLHDEDIEPLLDQTLSIVIRYWGMFTEDTRKCAYELVENILRNHNELVQDVYNTMPSLASIPEMSKFESELVDLKRKMDVRSQFLAFVRRCQSENATVVDQALTELVPYLLEHDEFLHRTVLGEQPDPVVAQLIRSLLDCCVKFNTSSDVITLLSARCIGLIGCMDPNRVDSIKEKKDILVLSNFDSMEETFDFILFFLQHVLVDAFLSASNTRAQGFLAYAMQNLLRFCGLDSAVTQRSRDVQADKKYERWSELPETVRNTLTPFLTSKYTVTVGAVNSSCTYPLFSATLTHGEWLRIFVQDLLQKGSGDNARLVFSTDSKDIEPLFQRLQDIYSQIDEPDGIEGISNHLHALNIDQQVLEHRKAGRWATAQSWYELQLEKEPNNVDAQWNLLTCLKESGQQGISFDEILLTQQFANPNTDAILTRFEILQTTDAGPRFVPFAIEASWITGKWEKLRSYLQLCSQQGIGDFNIGVGLALDAIRQGNNNRFEGIISGLRLSVAKSLNANSVASLQSCHDSILKLHALAEMESIAGLDPRSEKDTLPKIRAALSRRLDILGGHISDKQYLLGLRRAMMELTWEKAHYYLGKHYNKILDLEKAKPLGKEAQIYLSGEASKLVIDNYLRSLAHGNKYVFQSLPKVLTLWLEHASTVDQPFDPKRGNNEYVKHLSYNLL
ncbi:hypothetical protein APSETT445_008352 [Aspergillus pseudonomiae]